MASPNPSCPSFAWRRRTRKDEAKQPVFATRTSLSILVPAELQTVLRPRPPQEFSPDDLPPAFAAVKGSKRAHWLPAVVALRLALSKVVDPPIQAVVESGVLPRLAAFMSYADVAGLPLQAAWAATNVASGSSAQCAAVVEAGAVAPALALMNAQDAELREQVGGRQGGGEGKTKAPSVS
ncbi:Importin subunit alpha-2 [Tetrabaena socialis]|uniref:Importin subunit alpha-2 n=1 Tax=Tetrabaena socialis TaxID=47790 RepID=A0A2J8AGI3_9CHLO|nr:Importin subunit alpha-2 [Tetrabaena socialis]|eukprot:PNH11612.1 Importin subunit alpha-2 [Tetrabaena socialis]